MRLLPEVPTRAALNRRHGERFKWLALLVVGLGTIAAVLATTSFNVAVPALSKHFGLGQDQVQWAITGFLAALTVAMLPTPWLLDQVGFRRLFLGANLMLGITSLDPIKYDLSFERFINPDRPDFPDIDVDFQKSHRKGLIGYMGKRYGEDHVVAIGTKAKSGPARAVQALQRP